MKRGRKKGVEDLEGRFGGLKLSEEEQKAIKGARQTASSEAGRHPQAVGKLFGSKPGHADGLVQTLGRIWCPKEGTRCKELGNNLFLFTFLQPGGKHRAITEGPWEFGGNLLIVVDFDDSKRLKDLEFIFVPVWIRVFDLPLGLMNEEMACRIGDKVGRFLEVDKDEDGMAVGEFLRMKVLLDVRKPLFRGITLEGGEGKGERWCSFKYEFLPNFCYVCGRLGHVEKECDEGVWREEGKQFGEWLRVIPTRKKDGRGTWTEGGSSGGGYRQRKDASWGRSSRQKGTGSGEASHKLVEGVEDDLKYDGSIPWKLKASMVHGGTPKRLEFGAELSKGDEQLESGVAKSGDNSEVGVVGVSEVERTLLPTPGSDLVGGQREDGGEDLISVLSDSVLGEIVTRLPTIDAVRIQVLSTRWRNIWRSSPLNLDLSPNHYNDYKHLVSGILAAHPGPGRRLKVDWPYDDGESYNSWLESPALIGLQELGIEAGFSSGLEDKRALPRRDNTRALPQQALFRFAPTLRLLKISYHTFPSTGAMAALRLPHLELISFCCVDISEGTLHGLLAGCPVLRTLVLDGCTGFATVRINSPTITSFVFSPADSSTTNDYDSYGFDYNFFDYGNLRVRVTTWQVVIEDAPLLEKLVPCRSATAESFQLRVVSAPRLRVLGSLSFTIPKLEIGSTIFQPTSRRVNRVRPDNVIMEKRLLMQAVMLATTLRTVKILALEEADSIDVVSNYLKCFPCLEKLYISASQGYRSAASYDKQNPIECLEHHLKMVALDGYEGIRPHVKFAQFFVRNARFLELMKFRIFRNYHCEAGTTKEWIEDQQRQLQVRSIASQHVKFHFVRDTRYYQDVYCGEDITDLSEHIHDSSRDDPFDPWFESEKEALAC